MFVRVGESKADCLHGAVFASPFVLLGLLDVAEDDENYHGRDVDAVGLDLGCFCLKDLHIGCYFLAMIPRHGEELDKLVEDIAGLGTIGAFNDEFG